MCGARSPPRGPRDDGHSPAGDDDRQALAQAGYDDDQGRDDDEIQARRDYNQELFDELEPELRERIETDLMILEDDRLFIVPHESDESDESDGGGSDAYKRWSESRQIYVDELDTETEPNSESDEELAGRGPLTPEEFEFYRSWGFYVVEAPPN